MASSEPGDLPEYAERVLEVVSTIPPGRVLSYGDVAELVGIGGARQVGRVMATYGGMTAWWRVLYADGSLPPGHQERAARLLRSEGVALRGGRVRMGTSRWAGPEPRDVGGP